MDLSVPNFLYYKKIGQESGLFRTFFLQTPNLQLFSSETPMYRAFAGSWRLLQPLTDLSLTSNREVGWTLVGGCQNLQLVLRPLFIEVCGIFSWRLGVLSKVPSILLHIISKTLATVATLQNYLIIKWLRVTMRRQRQ